MNWVELLIPLIAVAVWIISTIIGSAQDKGPRRNLPKPPQQTAAPPPPTEESTRAEEEMQRRLEEARKKRQAEQERKAIANRQAQEREREKAREQERERARRRIEEPTHAAPAEMPRGRLVEAQPVEARSVPAPPATAMPAAVALVTPPAALPMALPAAPPGPVLGQVTLPATVTARPESQLAVNIRKMLLQPRSVATAVALREVLEPPLALRKRRAAATPRP